MTTGETQKCASVKGYEAVAMGGSAGGFDVLETILGGLPGDFSLALVVAQHLHPSDNGAFARHLAQTTALPVIEAFDKEKIIKGSVYVAPANYHLLVERDGTLALSIDEKVNWSRPSIDVLFASAARAWRTSLIAVILTGASADGAKGVMAVKKAGGLVIAQDPAEASSPLMPRAAIDTGAVDEVLGLDDIASRLIQLAGQNIETAPSA